MASTDIDQYFTYEGRLASFQKTTKKRASNASGRGGKVLNWPHKQIAPSSLAKAGFYFSPTPDNPDNAVCFMCEKSMDGWEAEDDPVHEHVSHSTNCGWAIVAAIEAGIGEYGKEDPGQPEMVAARKATFAGKWPHEGKRGWKCKTKQLVEAGWKFTPTFESDDMATCTYCELALDGWEPSDKPYDEHYNRSPDCPFFTLVTQFQGTKKKTARGKAARGSKASRLSVQSIATAASETASIADLTAEPEDSVLTTASTMTQGGKKGKGKKGAKGAKSKAKKEEPVEVEEGNNTVTEETTLQSPPAKAARGRKRGSEAVDESVTLLAEAPAPKRRATRTRGSTATVDSSIMTQDDTEMTDAPAPKKGPGRKKGRASNTKSTRKTSGSMANSTVASMASLRAPPGDFPDDDEIERQLEADLERQATDDEVMPYEATIGKSSHYHMFAPAPPESDGEGVEDELKALEAEMQVDEPERLQIPKKGRKAGTRKASKQTKPKKAKAPSPPPEEPEPEIPEPQLDEEVDDEQDASMGSTDTVVKKTEPAAPPKRGRGRPPKVSLAASENSVAIVEFVEPEPAEPPVKRGRGRPSKVSMASQTSVKDDVAQPAEALVKRGRGRPSKASLASRDSIGADNSKASEAPAKRGRGRPAKKTAEPTKRAAAVAKPLDQQEEVSLGPEEEDQDVSQHLGNVSQHLAPPPSTPKKIISPAPSARQPAISPSQSPQSSDAENQPPSSKPTNSSTTKRIALAPVTATPMRGSPSKRNVLAGLQSTTPWTSANLDAMLGTPRAAADKENGVERLMKQGKDMTSPEKGMTVEEWIYFNASEAEKKLKHECEAMVNKFETEGSKAMNVLEGLTVE